MNGVVSVVPESKEANSKIARDRSVNVNSASGKDKAVAKRVAVASRVAEAADRAVDSKADDKTRSPESRSGGR
jgi:hypothetical protein